VHDQAALGHLARVTRTVLTNRNPWLLYKSSATFGNYLGSYGVLLSCIAGPMIADYWIVRRGHYRINDLYTAKKEGWYWYTYGINWRAYAAYLM
jgi:NCS1 family nucleobase:cation symporter-1